jgi:hypothetical protein
VELSCALCFITRTFENDDLRLFVYAKGKENSAVETIAETKKAESHIPEKEDAFYASSFFRLSFSERLRRTRRRISPRLLFSPDAKTAERRLFRTIRSIRPAETPFAERNPEFPGFSRGETDARPERSLRETAATYSRGSLETRIQNINRISTSYRLYRQNINRLSTNLSIISTNLEQTPSGQKLYGENSLKRRPVRQKAAKRKPAEKTKREFRRPPQIGPTGISPSYDQFFQRTRPFSGLHLLLHKRRNGAIHGGRHRRRDWDSDPEVLSDGSLARICITRLCDLSSNQKCGISREGSYPCLRARISGMPT